ncbi:HTH_48 domain-containing protein [Trichonephila clavipes]|nr:HTH_48 domain-containing protein [Trichonephila clavipes]
MTSRHSCTRFVVDHTIQDASVCDAASSVAAAMVSELRVNAAANVVELFTQTLVLKTTPVHDSGLVTWLHDTLRPFDEMDSQIPEEIHIRHCMLLEFHKGSNATVATKNICDVYPSALDVRKCQRWFSKFRSGNFDLSDSHRSGRPKTSDNDVIKGASGSKSVSDNRLTVKCS